MFVKYKKKIDRIKIKIGQYKFIVQYYYILSVTWTINIGTSNM